MKGLVRFNQALEAFRTPKEKLIYPPIHDSRGIRLIRILPGSRQAGVKCELQPAVLGPDLSQYTALSYCWGDASDKTWISCNGRRLAVTRDLCNALRRFRRVDGIVTFWIDQICIDQENLEERSSQVQFMRDIYKGAEGVFVWLGDEADDSKLAIEFLPHLLHILNTSDQYISEYAQNNPALPSWSAKEWRALSALLCRPWFGRMWILQEVALASNATLVCGQDAVSWDNFFNFIERSSTTHLWTSILDDFNPESSNVVRSRLMSILLIKNTYDKEGSITSIHALWLSRYFNASDPRDKVFALFGLCENNVLTHADYSKHISEVYRDVAVRLLFPQDQVESNGGPSAEVHYPTMGGILCEAERTENKFALPSWVPDWTSRSYDSLWSSIEDVGYRAACCSSSKVSLMKGTKRIVIAGKICDSVHRISRIAPRTGIRREASIKNVIKANQVLVESKTQLNSWILESSKIASTCQRYPSPEAKDVAYRQTLIGNRAVENGKLYKIHEHPNRSNGYATMYWHFRQFMAILYPGGVINSTRFFDLGPLLDQHMQGFQNFEQALTAVTQGRRLFSSMGGYIGLGPPGMCPGDLVCVFLGGNIPWAVRPDGDVYSLIGECYMHGIMDGEVMHTEYLPVQNIILN